jgi:hypothetical protein
VVGSSFKVGINALLFKTSEDNQKSSYHPHLSQHPVVISNRSMKESNYSLILQSLLIEYRYRKNLFVITDDEVLLGVDS